MSDPTVDFKKIVEGIESYHNESSYEDDVFRSVGKHHERVFRSLVDGVRRSGDVKACYYYINSDTYDKLKQTPYENGEEGDDFDVLFTHRPVKKEVTMPDNIVLLMSPDAVTLAGSVVEPENVALGKFVAD